MVSTSFLPAVSKPKADPKTPFRPHSGIAITIHKAPRQITTWQIAPIHSLVPTYRSAIRSLGKEGKWRHALNLLKQLREEDDGPADTGCYGEAMNACRHLPSLPSERIAER